MSDPDSAKQQFNVYLPTALVREVKHACVDSGLSLSAWVEQVLRAALAGELVGPAASEREEGS